MRRPRRPIPADWRTTFPQLGFAAFLKRVAGSSYAKIGDELALPPVFVQRLVEAQERWFDLESAAANALPETARKVIAAHRVGMSHRTIVRTLGVDADEVQRALTAFAQIVRDRERKAQRAFEDLVALRSYLLPMENAIAKGVFVVGDDLPAATSAAVAQSLGRDGDYHLYDLTEGIAELKSARAEALRDATSADPEDFAPSAGLRLLHQVASTQSVAAAAKRLNLAEADAARRYQAQITGFLLFAGHDRFPSQPHMRHWQWLVERILTGAVPESIVYATGKSVGPVRIQAVLNVIASALTTVEQTAERSLAMLDQSRLLLEAMEGAIAAGKFQPHSPIESPPPSWFNPYRSLERELPPLPSAPVKAEALHPSALARAFVASWPSTSAAAARAAGVVYPRTKRYRGRVVFANADDNLRMCDFLRVEFRGQEMVLADAAPSMLLLPPDNDSLIAILQYFGLRDPKLPPIELLPRVTQPIKLERRLVLLRSRRSDGSLRVIVVVTPSKTTTYLSLRRTLFRLQTKFARYQASPDLLEATLALVRAVERNPWKGERHFRRYLSEFGDEIADF